MVKRAEIRVHASAATTRRDDERYSAQAESYLACRAHRLLDLSSTEEDNGGEDELGVAPPSSTRHSSEAQQQSTTFLDETQLAWTAIESQIWPGSSPAPVNTLVPVRPRVSQASQDRRLRAATPQQQVESQRSSDTDRTRSSYLRSPELGRSAKRKHVGPGPSSGRYFRQPDASDLVYTTIPENSGMGIAYTGRRARSSPHPNSDPTVTKANADQASEETVSELPTSYDLSDTTSPESRALRSKSPSNSNRIISNTTEQPQALAQSDQSTQRPSPIRPQQPPVPPLAPPPRPSDETSETSIRDFASDPLSSQHLLEISTFPLQLHPPPPSTVSNLARGSNITHALKTLANHAINSHYIPTNQTRELDPAERGTWIIDTTPWPLHLQIKFWKYLTNLIKNGSLGWGIWCSREAGPRGDLGIIRIFCWGEVVRHIYLVLYAASESKVRRMGLKWVDADGEEVITMPC